MRYRWHFPPQPNDEAEQLERSSILSALQHSINVPESIAAILIERGIRTFEEARDFFRPSLDHLLDPYLLNDMDRAVERIQSAIAQGENITVFGDYDVDGTTSTAMLSMFLESLGSNASFHTPDRFTEGYGLTIAGIDRCLNSPNGKPALIIAIDCGITAIEAVAYANSHNVQVIICDHHEPADTIPDAYAILNPIKPGCNYPNKHLCGCGVGFKLIQALAGVFDRKAAAYEFLDFVSLASSADIVSLRGENRILTAYGLKLINDHPRPGLKALIDAAHIQQGKIGTSQIVFGLAPRINAAGRLGDGARAVTLLRSRTREEALECATELELVNSDRRKIDEEAFLEASALVDATLNRETDRVLVLHNAGWHAGVIGIVASRLVERYHLPVILLTTIDGIARGSARSIPGFDIHAALKECESELVTFGGHKYAAGVSIRVEQIPQFRESINRVAHKLISEDMLQPRLHISASIDLNELTPQYFAIIRQFSPFGPDNLRPIFHAKNVEVVGLPRLVGQGVTHLKCKFRSNTPHAFVTGFKSPNVTPFTLGGGTIEAIGFGLGERLTELTDIVGKPRRDLEIVFALDENEYNGRITPQLLLRDLK